MTNLNPSWRIWKNFARNKLAVTGLIIIFITVVTALLGYLIMPDQTPEANNMLLSLNLKKPGSRFTFLKIKKSEKVDTVNFLEKILFGQNDIYHEVPITSFKFNKDSIIVDQYIGAGDKPEKVAYNIFEVYFGKKVQVSDKELVKETQQRIETTNIIHKTYLLGTDLYGRDLLSRLMLGSRISLAVGLISVIISLILGVTIGAAAGYYGGRVDAFLSWLMNVIWALPALLLVIAISFALGKGLWQIFIAVGISMWVDVARLVRGQVITLKQFEYVEAARALGFKNYRIIRTHILPNIIGPILVLASSNFASAILLEAGLSFLGFGAQPPVPTWGGMIKEHYGYIIMDAAYLALFPGLAIIITVYAFNLVTIGLRDAFNVTSQNTRI